MTQATLAEQAKVSCQTINAIESGKFTPSTLPALKIAKIFQTTVAQLFTLEAQEISPFLFPGNN